MNLLLWFSNESVVSHKNTKMMIQLHVDARSCPQVLHASCAHCQSLSSCHDDNTLLYEELHSEDRVDCRSKEMGFCTKWCATWLAPSLRLAAVGSRLNMSSRSSTWACQKPCGPVDSVVGMSLMHVDCTNSRLSFSVDQWTCSMMPSNMHAFAAFATGAMPGMKPSAELSLCCHIVCMKRTDVSQVRC